MSQLSEIVPDQFYNHSGDAPPEVSTNFPIEAFCNEIRTNHGESKSRTIALVEWYKEGMIHHEYLIIQVRVPGRKDVWVRLERAAKRSARTHLLPVAPASLISHYPPNDNVSRLIEPTAHWSDTTPIKAKISGSRDALFDPGSVLVSSVSFTSPQSPPNLVTLECVLSALTKNSTTYSLTKVRQLILCV